MRTYKDIPKKALEKLYRENLSLARIGKYFCVSEPTVSRAIEFHQIPKRKPLQYKSSENPVEHRKTLKMAALYQKGATLDAVGKPFGLTRQGVRERFIQAGIEYRRRAPKYTRIDKKRLVKLYTGDNLPLDKIAASFNINLSVIREALKYYEIPKRGSIIKGAYIIKVLKSLKVGESKEIEISAKTYSSFYPAAKRLGIKISIRRSNGTIYRITRLA